MDELELEIKPTEWISCGTVGKPGERTFFIQASGKDQQATLLVEKVQLQTLGQGVEEFLADIYQRFPNLTVTSPNYDRAEMKLRQPIDPLYRVGEIGLAYDEEEDLVVFLLREIMTTQESEEDLHVVRLWITRTQLVSLLDWAKEIISHGRQLCPQCGEPMDPAGHLCPKKNGHKK